MSPFLSVLIPNAFSVASLIFLLLKYRRISAVGGCYSVLVNYIIKCNRKGKEKFIQIS